MSGNKQTGFIDLNNGFSIVSNPLDMLYGGKGIGSPQDIVSLATNQYSVKKNKTTPAVPVVKKSAAPGMPGGSPVIPPALEEPQSVFVPGAQEKPSENPNMMLGDLVSQAFAGLGAGLQGRDVGKTNEAFNQMRKERFAEEDLNELKDPNSQKSRVAREQLKKVFANVKGFNIPDSFSAFDAQTKLPMLSQAFGMGEDQRKEAKADQLREQARRDALAKANAPKKSDPKKLDEYREHLTALGDTAEQARLIGELNRTGIGSVFPDFLDSTRSKASAINAASIKQAKALAGPGAFTDTDRSIYVPLTAGANENSDLAKKKIYENVKMGVNTAIGKLDADVRSGNVSVEDYNRVLYEYDQKLQSMGLTLDNNNQIVPLKGK